MQSEADLVERVVNRLPLQEAEAVLSRLEDELISVETIDAGLGHEDLLGLSGIGFSELQCDVVLLSDVDWESKYGGAQDAAEAADADPYAWMAASLARLLPDRLQAPSKIWQDTMSALRAADVQSEAQLMSMTKAQLRSSKVPVVASVHLQRALQAEAAQPDTDGSFDGSSEYLQDCNLAVPSSTPPATPESGPVNIASDGEEIAAEARLAAQGCATEAQRGHSSSTSTPASATSEPSSANRSAARKGKRSLIDPIRPSSSSRDIDNEKLTVQEGKLDCLLARVTDTKLEPAINLLITIHGNIVNNPDDPMKRRIRWARIQQRLDNCHTNVSWARDFLKESGFVFEMSAEGVSYIAAKAIHVHNTVVWNVYD